MLDKKSKILFIVLTILVLLAVATTYYNTHVLRDFVIIDDLEEDMEE